MQQRTGEAHALGGNCFTGGTTMTRVCYAQVVGGMRELAHLLGWLVDARKQKLPLETGECSGSLGGRGRSCW